MAWGKGESKGVADLVAKLRGNTTGKTMMIMRFRRFGESPFVISVHFYSCLLTLPTHISGTEEVEMFCKALAENQSLEELLCSGHSLSPSAVDAFAEMLRKNRHLKHLSLGCAKLGDQGVATLLDNWDNAILEVLDLEYKSLGLQGMHALRHVLQGECGLRELRLGRNGLNDEAVAALAEGVEKSSTLTKLLVDQNAFGSTGCKALGLALRRNQGPSRMFELDLSSNTAIGNEGLAALLSVGKDDGSVEKKEERVEGLMVEGLNLEACGIGSDGITQLERLLLGNDPHCFSRLRVLNVARNDVREIGELVEFPALRELNVMGNKLGVEGLGRLAKVLKKTQLQSLHLGDVGFDVDEANLEEAKEALGFIADSPLKHVWFLGNRLGDTAVEHLASELEENRHLETLGLSATGISSDGCMRLLTVLERTECVQTLEIGGHAFDERVRALVDELKERVPSRDIALDKGQDS